MKRIAIVAASGIGDALIMQIAAHNFRESGWEVTTFSDHLSSFGRWLSGYCFAKQPPLDDLEDLFLEKFDAIFLQHDNSPKAKKIGSLPLPVYTFYGSHLLSKHGPLQVRDYVCDPQKTMVANLVQAVGRILGACSIENGLRPPPDCTFRKHPKRIALHPTSASREKNWPREKFLSLADRLKRKGFEPVFTVSPKERAEWDSPLFPTLESLTSFLYESGGFIGNDSGLGHIASYLQIPYTIIGPNRGQMELWKPGWHPGSIVIPPSWSSLFKWTRQKWKSFIPVRSVIKGLISNNEINLIK